MVMIHCYQTAARYLVSFLADRSYLSEEVEWQVLENKGMRQVFVTLNKEEIDHFMI
jgi:hypothetical protein